MKSVRFLAARLKTPVWSFGFSRGDAKPPEGGTRNPPRTVIGRLFKRILTALLLAPCLALSQDTPRQAVAPARLHRIDPQSPPGLRDLFKHTGESLPFVSAHRGGARKGFPENCIATFENTLRHTFAILEIDPRYTKDGAIVLHHDPTLERTTTGKGRVADLTLPELKRLRLKDPEGNVTEFQIPTLDEVLEWARGRTILVLDQKDVPVAARIKKIEEHRAEAYAMLIVTSFKDVQACHALNPKIMMEVMIPNREKFAQFDKLGVPWRNVVAFVGHTPPEDTTLYEWIHGKGTSCMVGSSRNLDRQFLGGQVTDIKQLEPGYGAFLQRGADLIETDIPIDLGQLLYGSSPVPSSKRQFFHTPWHTPPHRVDTAYGWMGLSCGSGVACFACTRSPAPAARHVYSPRYAKPPPQRQRGGTSTVGDCGDAFRGW